MSCFAYKILSCFIYQEVTWRGVLEKISRGVLHSNKGIKSPRSIAHISVQLHIFLCNCTYFYATANKQVALMRTREEGQSQDRSNVRTIRRAVSRLCGETRRRWLVFQIFRYRGFGGGSGPDLQHVHFGQQCITMDA